MADEEILLLRRDEVAELLDLPSVVDRIVAEMSHAAQPSSLREHVARPDGAFHLVCGVGGPERRPLAALKLNRRFDDPAVGATRGFALLVADDGRPLAVLDSAALTMMRTAALVTVATRELARPDADSLLVVGSGKLAPHVVEAALLARPFRSIELWSRTSGHAEDTARDVTCRLGRDVRAVTDLAEAAGRATTIVSVTASREPLLHAADVRPGAFIAAMGSDGPGKQELDVALLARARIVVDNVAHASANGELAHAIRQGVLTAADVHAELAEVVTGRRTGRMSGEDIVVLDSTGTALQDLAAAALAVERAEQRGLGTRIGFS